MENNKETEKDKFIAAINLLSDKLTKLNISLDVLRTNINVTQFYLNDMFKMIKNKEKLEKQDKEIIIKTLELYNDLNETELLADINNISKKILLLNVDGIKGEKKK